MCTGSSVISLIFLKTILINAHSATTVHKKIWEPKHWQEQLDNIKAMRASRSAPVDHIGASKLPEPAAVPQVN